MKILIASSTQGVRYAESIQENLSQVAQTEVWNQGVFHLSDITIKKLYDELNEIDFLIVVLTPDDQIGSGNDTTGSPRDNVLLELGMGIGTLTLERTFVACTSKPMPKLPVDLAGVTYAYFDQTWDNTTAALGKACTQIKTKVEKLGPRSRQMRSAQIAFVMNFGEQFSREVSRGFRHAVAGCPFSILDNEDHRRLHHETEAEFWPALRKAVSLNVDFLIIVPPNMDISNSPDFAEQVSAHAGHGGHVFLIENAPEAHPFGDSVTAIRSDSKKGAQMIARQASQFAQDADVLILAGPQDSENAVTRSKTIKEELMKMAGSHQPAEIREFQSNSWSRDDADVAVGRYIKQRSGKSSPSVIICGNDDMALGAEDAVLRLSAERDKYHIFGYDGTCEAVFAIASSWHPLLATVRVPTHLYGVYAADEIKESMSKSPHSYKPKPQLLIKVGEANLITRERVKSLLRSAIWAV